MLEINRATQTNLRAQLNSAIKVPYTLLSLVELLLNPHAGFQTPYKNPKKISIGHSSRVTVPIF